MKMTKIESARIIVGQKGRCPVTLKCKTCFTKNGVCGGVENRLALAEAYIKRHESKSKKKDHILDTTKKVEEPIKTVGIDNSDVTLALTAQHDPIPLQIAKMIRDDRYRCLKVANCKGCPLRLVRNCGNGTEFAINEERKLRRQLIDDYISANEPVKDCPANSEIPKPVKFEDEVPEYVYIVTNNAVLRREVVQFVHQRYKTQKSDMFILTAGGNTMSFDECYRTPEEALQVAKKLWNGEAK